MTLEQANQIRELLNARDHMIVELRNLESCESITGHINEGPNGLGFGWRKDSRQIQYLIDGTKKDIKAVEDMISSIQTKER